MLDHIATLFYTQVHDHHLSLQKRLNLENPCHLSPKCRKADAKITLCEAACLTLLFQASGSTHFKRFLDWHRPVLLRLFPTLPSYGRLIVWLKKAEALLLSLADSKRSPATDRASVMAIDSTKIDSHKIKNNPKALRASSGIGHTHEGIFIGMKLHVLANRQGQIVAFDLSAAHRHDLAAVKGGLLDGVRGLCFADSGYISEQIRQELRAQDLAFIAKPQKHHETRWLFDKIWAKPYRQRQVVEGVFSLLKRGFGLLAHSARNAASLRSRIWASLAAFMILKPASK